MFFSFLKVTAQLAIGVWVEPLHLHQQMVLQVNGVPRVITVKLEPHLPLLVLQAPSPTSLASHQALLALPARAGTTAGQTGYLSQQHPAKLDFIAHPVPLSRTQQMELLEMNVPSAIIVLKALLYQYSVHLEHTCQIHKHPSALTVRLDTTALMA